MGLNVFREYPALRERLREKLNSAKRPLVIGVGGGNDAVSTLFLQEQLRQDFEFQPDSVSVLAVLPDCLEYHHGVATAHPLVQEITPFTERSVQGKKMTQFPERVFSEHRAAVGIDHVLGVSMKEGSRGIADALRTILADQGHDLVLACDIGGDFVAVPQNQHVLSPMMDGYMLSALRELQTDGEIPMVFGLFGLGTDGETPPALLSAALEKIGEVHEGQFDPSLIEPLSRFHRDVVEPVRYSRTADFTLREILGEGHPNPAEYRAKFHIKPSHESETKLYSGPFMHDFDPYFFGKYYLFDSLSNVDNPYAVECSNGLEWFLRISDTRTRINHELNGQAYIDLSSILHREDSRGKSIFFGTPSHKFNLEIQAGIVDDVVRAIRNSVYDHALLFSADASKQVQTSLVIEPVTNNIAIVSARTSEITHAICAMGRSI